MRRLSNGPAHAPSSTAPPHGAQEEPAMKQRGLFPAAQAPALPWVSAPVRIGNHDWRLKRIETLNMLATRTERYLNYEWSPAGQDDWRPQHEWPALWHPTCRLYRRGRPRSPGAHPQPPRMTAPGRPGRKIPGNDARAACPRGPPVA